MNRGSALVLSGRLGPLKRFNEAPIHESGKSIVARQASAARNGFNEAPIHESGKFHVKTMRRSASAPLQ